MADQSRTIRLPVHLVEQVNKLARIKRDLHQKLGREATDEELAAESGLTPEKVSDLLDHSRDPVSLDMPVPPEPVADGGIYCCTKDDEEEAAAMIPNFYTEIGEEAPSYERCLEKVRAYIAGNGFFFWKNKNGKTVACCFYKLNDRFASISSVYTFPDERRKHYAQNLVYQVTRKVSEMGYIPMLYTDADYQASNACYEKIGYILRGKLCTVAITN